MALNTQKLRIFLDANILIQQGAPPGGPTIDFLKNLVEIGRVEVLTTEVTLNEVTKHFFNHDYKHIKGLTRTNVRNLIASEFDTELPELSSPELIKKLWQRHSTAVRQQLDSLRATFLDINVVPPMKVLEAYSKAEGFFSHESKKDQFPDSFIFEALKLDATANGPMIIVSKDADFMRPASSDDLFRHLHSLDELFSELELKFEASEIEAFLKSRLDELRSLVNEALPNFGFFVTDVADADAYFNEVDEVRLLGIADYSIESEEILTTGRMKVKATFEISHPNWDEAAYDSETKSLIPFDSVYFNKSVDLEIDFALTILVTESGLPDEIDDFQIRGERSLYFEIDSDWPYL